MRRRASSDSSDDEIPVVPNGEVFVGDGAALSDASDAASDAVSVRSDATSLPVEMLSESDAAEWRSESD